LRSAAELAGGIALRVPINADMTRTSMNTSVGICFIDRPAIEDIVAEETLRTSYAAPHPRMPPSRPMISDSLISSEKIARAR